MRRITMLSMAVAGASLLMFAAVAGAGWYHDSGSSGGSTSEMTSPSSEPGPAPEVGNYQGQEATEAGKLPEGESSMGSGTENAGPGSFQNQELGGSKVREDIDTTP